MANNYQPFSAGIDNLTSEESAWLKEVLSQDIEAMEGEARQVWLDRFQVSDDGRPWPGFDWNLIPKDNFLHVYAEEAGDIDAVIGVVQEFLKKFRPNSCFALQWANTCSSMRVDNFGGGAAFVTATSREWISTDYWLTERQLAHVKKGGDV